jgi:hypothetical protein
LVVPLLLGGCITPQDVAAQDPGVRATVSSDGKFQLLSRDGRPLPRCQFCTEELEKEFGKGCVQDKHKSGKLNPPLCVGGTFTTVDQIAVVRTRVNPYCFVFYQFGQAFQGPCYCYPDETPPPGVVCANR